MFLPVVNASYTSELYMYTAVHMAIYTFQRYMCMNLPVNDPVIQSSHTCKWELIVPVIHHSYTCIWQLIWSCIHPSDACVCQVHIGSYIKVVYEHEGIYGDRS